jgi:diguanylate cyclase (GGDEF)-like protein
MENLLVYKYLLLIILGIIAAAAYILYLRQKRKFRILSTEYQKMIFHNEDISQQAKILEVVNEVAESFAKNPNLNNTLGHILDSIKELLNVEIGIIELFSKDGTAPSFALCKGADNIKLDDVVYTNIQRGNSILVNDLKSGHTEFSKYNNIVMQGVVSVLLAPLRIHDRVLGLLGILSKNDNGFTGKELRMLTIFASQASIIIQNAALLKKTQELSVTDELTGLYNFRYFKNKIEEEFIRASRYNHNLSLLIFDLDHFKSFNDTYGHPVGNIVLKILAQILKDNSRPTDFICRYGGEEFTLILTETTKENAFICAERIRHKVESKSIFDEKNQPIMSLTITAGVSSFPTDKPFDAKQMIEFADKALYSGKEAGRNRVVLYQNPDNNI